VSDLSPEFWALCGLGFLLLVISGQLQRIEGHLDRIRENTFDKERFKRERGW
jgi:hypothetical protein